MQNLRLQLLLSHLLIILLMGFVLAGSVVAFSWLGRSIDRILHDNYQSVTAAQTMKEALERQDNSLVLFLAGQKERAKAQYEASAPVFARAYHTEAGNVTEVGEKEIADAIGSEWASYQRKARALLYANPPLAPESAQAAYFSTLEPAFVHLRAQAQAVQDLNQSAIFKADKAAREEAKRDTLLGVGVSVFALLIGLVTALHTVNVALHPLTSLARQAEAVGTGQLNQQIAVRRTDEIGVLAQSFNTMIEKLQEARREEADRLRRAERMSDAALENLYDPVIVTDAHAYIVHLNRAAEGLFGRAAQARNKPARDFLREPRLSDAIEQAVQKEHVSAEEGEAALIVFASQAGGQRTYRLRVTPMHGQDNAHIGAVAVLEDVTYQQEVDRLKTEFIGVASHELRTPVTSLILSVQLLQEGAAGTLSPAQAEVVQAQKDDLARLEAMMRDLLDLTRLEAGATPPRFEMVSPIEILTSARQAVQRQANAKSLRLMVQASESLPLVRADKALIGRVLLNLLGNALRHTPNFGRVILRAEINEDRPFVAFSVSDTGSGIAPEYLDRIFERFVQVPGATRGGAGLGLSLAQTIVQAQGGEIFARSEPHQGSVFTFTLPTVNPVSIKKESSF